MLRFSGFLLVALFLVLVIVVSAKAEKTEAEFGVYIESRPAEVTEVSELIGDEAEVNILKLGQAFPNPFNNQTIILVQNPKEQDLCLKVYNLLGQEVSTLFENRYSKGRIEAIWDGKDWRGETVGSGVYLVVLETLEQQQTARIIFLK